MVFFRKDGSTKTCGTDLEDKINTGVFPMCQGGPHMATIAALAVQLKEVTTPVFKEYAAQVKRNSAALAAGLIARGHSVVTGGSDNHLCLWDLRPKGLTGSKMEKLLDACHITTNKNTVFGDKSALSPGGIRLGTCALTTRGFNEADMDQVAEILDRCCSIALRIQESAGKKLADFLVAMKGDAELEGIDKEVYDFATGRYMPGWNIEEMQELSKNPLPEE